MIISILTHASSHAMIKVQSTFNSDNNHENIFLITFDYALGKERFRSLLNRRDSTLSSSSSSFEIWTTTNIGFSFYLCHQHEGNSYSAQWGNSFTAIFEWYNQSKSPLWYTDTFEIQTIRSVRAGWSKRVHENFHWSGTKSQSSDQNISARGNGA